MPNPLLGAGSLTKVRDGPNYITGLALWYDAKQQSGFAHNDAMTSITDFSGNAYTGTQTTASKQPTFTTAGINGDRSFSFDGGDVLRAVNTTFSQPISIVGVARATSLVNNHQIDGGNGGTSRCVVFIEASSVRIFGGAAVASTAAISTGSAFDFYAIFDGANSQITIGTGTPTAGNAGTQGHSTISFGAEPTPSLGWEGLIGEYAIYNGVALTTQNIQSLRRYFVSRWGV